VSESAFTLYALDNPALAHTLRAKLIKRRNELVGQLAGGYVQDWPDYKHRVGTIAGIDEAIGICEQIEKEERS